MDKMKSMASSMAAKASGASTVAMEKAKKEAVSVCSESRKNKEGKKKVRRNTL